MTPANRQRFVNIVFDYFMTMAGWICFNIFRFISLPNDFNISLGRWLLDPVVMAGTFIVPLMLVVFYAVSGYYNEAFRRSRLDDLLNTLIVTFIAVIVIFFSVLVDDDIPERLKNYELMMAMWGCLFLPVFIVRYIISVRNKKLIRRGLLSFNTLIVGEPERAARLAQRLAVDDNTLQYNVMAYVDDIPARHAAGTVDRPVYDFADIEDICGHLDVKTVIVVARSGDMKRTIDIINRLYRLGVRIMLTPEMYHIITGRPRVTTVVGEPLVDVTTPHIPYAVANLKRLGDILVSALALLSLSPVYAAIAIAVRRDSDGPVFYRQERVGYHKKNFNIIKFRTMRPDAEAAGPALSSDSDSRVTRVGHFLRKYRLDELPQFWNVLVGDMSLVGPRPERKYYIDKIVEQAPYYALIHQVRPGITSLGMVKYGYASTVAQMVERLSYDLIYLENVSFGFDLKILLYTVRTVIKGRGV